MDFQNDLLETPPAWFNAMEENLSAIPDSAHKSEAERAAHARRREQVRRAQRNHRQRKEKYIKDIEAEVIRLRQHEAAHEEALRIREENELLKQMLIAHNIPLPSNLSSQTSSPISVSVFDQPDGSQDLRATISPSYSSPGAVPSDHLPERHVAKHFTAAQFAPGLDTLPTEPHLIAHQAASLDPHQIVQNPNASWLQSQPRETDISQIALDFVLGLEQPCLRHHRTHSFPDGETNGHVLMIQSPILSRCSAPICTDSKREHIDTSSSWSAPLLEVEKLLDLSTRLTLDGEITPVEAWRRIKEHPGFQLLDKASIEALKDMILPEVMCYGFGAVIDEAYFECTEQPSLKALVFKPYPNTKEALQSFLTRVKISSGEQVLRSDSLSVVRELN